MILFNLKKTPDKLPENSLNEKLIDLLSPILLLFGYPVQWKKIIVNRCSSTLYTYFYFEFISFFTTRETYFVL